MKLSSLFTPGVITVAPAGTLATVAELMESHNIGAVVVEENRRPVGIITDRDLALALGSSRRPLDTPVREVMTRHVLAIPESTDLLTATQYLRERRVRRLPVVDANDQLIGMVTLDDLLRVLGREMVNLAESIKDEVHVR